MGNTDIVAAPLSDANEKNTTEHSTIFDDVFRTIAQKMPQLLIPLINEVFHTSYSEEDHFEQLRNEHYENLELWSRIPLSGSQPYLSSGVPILKRQNDGHTHV